MSTLGKWFDICYTSDLGQQIQTIPARGNFWGSDNANPDDGTLHYGIHHASASCGPGGSEVGLNFSDKASQAPTGCPFKPITDQDHFPPVIGDLCGLQIGDHELLSGAMADALAAYFHKLDIDEATDGTHHLFNTVAGLSNGVRGELAQDCRHLIDVARIFANMGSKHAAMMALPQSSPPSGATGASLQVYPNPTDELLNLELPARTSYTIRAYSLDGKEMLSELAPGGSHQIGTGLWPEGLYILQVLELSTGEKWEEKVVIQR
ncbi:MAG: T9SS type A sorting domain-containing protein [Bacteroidetes bacterium]|nr:T9SS type A sorting domain-containing protein [Bacteroidota bacterium]